jgi:hypothetical protein
MKIKKALKIGLETGKNTRREFGLIGGILRVLFGRKKVLITEDGAYAVYDF